MTGAQEIARREPSASAKGGRYHHGNLRQDLLRVAREEIARNGAQAVSLTSLARLAGVTQPAPYRHFADRDALLEGVALCGFEELAAVLDHATDGRASADAPRAAVLAYLTYGEANSEIYRLMFASNLVPRSKPESALGRAADLAFVRFHEVLAAAAPDIGRDAAYMAWAQLHGLVMLKADGFIARPLSEYVAQVAWLNPSPGARN